MAPTMTRTARTLRFSAFLSNSRASARWHGSRWSSRPSGTRCKVRAPPRALPPAPYAAAVPLAAPPPLPHPLDSSLAGLSGPVHAVDTMVLKAPSEIK